LRRLRRSASLVDVPRPLRDRDPGTFHVTVKALGPGPYYFDVLDRLIWTATLARVLVRLARSWTLISYCQMTTHVHTIVEVADTSLSFGMQLLNGEYTRATNREHARRGPLLTRRFHAVRIKSEAQLATAFRYDARNPVAAGVCSSPAEWPYSTYAGAVGLDMQDGMTDPSRVLAVFGAARDAAMRDLRDFVEHPREPRRATG
jgi:putative transposase